MKCNHVVGWSYPVASMILEDDERDYLKNFEDEGSIKFSYCPLCGEWLKATDYTRFMNFLDNLENKPSYNIIHSTYGKTFVDIMGYFGYQIQLEFAKDGKFVGIGGVED